MTLHHMVAGSGDLSEHDRVRLMEKEGTQAVYLHVEKIRTKVLASAVGGLVEPKALSDSIPGKDDFKGPIFHSARWRYDVDLKDKNVVVVGTGCSAAQFVPRLTKDHGAKSVTQLMRSPPWVVPRALPPFGQQNWDKWAPWLNTHVPGFALGMRGLAAATSEYDWRLFGISAYAARQRAQLESALLTHMRAVVPEKYHEILTPDYSVGCKRRVFDASWFPGLSDPRIELTTLPLTAVGTDTVTLGPGRLYPPLEKGDCGVSSEQVTIPADVIVLANGFDTTKWLHSLKITGRTGQTLEETFDERGGPQMYMGTAMDGFPNFFTIFGPNTATGHSSVILASENMVNLALKLMKPVLEGKVETVEVKREAEVAWARDIQAKCKQTVFHQGGCHSWYKDANDWNSTAYPYVSSSVYSSTHLPTALLSMYH